MSPVTREKEIARMNVDMRSATTWHDFISWKDRLRWKLGMISENEADEIKKRDKLTRTLARVTTVHKGR